MSCAHPLIGFPTGKQTINGKPEYRIVSSSVLANLESSLDENLNPGAILIPCGKCIGCRLDYSRRWADRMILELETAKKAIFLTLTYDDNHAHPCKYKDIVPYEGYYPQKKNEFLNEDGTLTVPEFYTLDKRDCQLFMKRLRSYFPDKNLRYYLAGEYGEKTLRPHYHLILYGLSVDDFKVCDRGVRCCDCTISEYGFKKCSSDLISVHAGVNEMGDQYFSSPFLQKIWKNGHVLFSDVTWKTCAYVARYVTKKVGGDLEKSYEIRNCEKEFSLMSRNPGIGKKYFELHPECIDSSSICVSTEDGAKKISIPQYYLRLAELTEKEKVDIIKERRKLASVERTKIELSNTSLPQLEYLESKEQTKKKSVKSLGRGKI